MGNTAPHTPYKKVSFDEIDYKNPDELKAAQDSALKEQFVRLYALRTVREALQKCYKSQQVNHYENCKDIAEKYLDMLPTHRINGYMAYQRNDPSK
ncbi:uncharacterized protein V1510DRAFT_405189 [Dipodascopsis tothii]|uniref:uncharacterized protein n=1 Tax=Dipodascopsis tothii TaxID=44089 RepID=UPI0034CF7C36